MKHPPLHSSETICLVVESTESFRSKIKSLVERISIRPRTIRVTDRDVHEMFFTKIHITESAETYVEIHPLLSYQPNSDLLSMAALIFPRKQVISADDFFWSGFQNSISISLGENDFCNLMRLLGHILCIETYKQGSYYYVPFADGYIKGWTLSPFLSMVFILLFLRSAGEVDPAFLVLKSYLYFRFPMISIIVPDPHCCYLIPVYSVINFKICFLYSLFVYLYHIVVG
jgi:hypothetical protein